MTARVPRLRREADLTGLPLKPADGYVLSCIDGASTVEQIASVTGVQLTRVEEIVELLVSHGAADWVELEEKRSPSAKAGPIPTKPPPPGGASRTLYDPKELDEPGVDLGLERRRVILDTFYRLEDLDFYEILQIEDDADKAAIRKAYFALSKVFHPDTAFGKSLGSYKAKMEAVFKRLTEAYDVLGKKRSRKEYDNYIKLRRKTRAAQKRLEVGAREAQRLEEEVSATAQSAVVVPEDEGAAPVDANPSAEPKPAPIVPPPPESARPPPRAPAGPIRARSDAAKERARRLMARKLAAATGRKLPGTQPKKPPVEKPEQTAEEAKAGRAVLLRGLARSLKQVATYTGGVDRAEATMQRANAAEAKGDLVSAANLLRMAVALSQERPDIVEKYEQVSFEVAKSMADDYETRAKYEEDNHQWKDAALSWAKVCEGRPQDGNAHVHAARAILEANGDLGTARLFAQKGAELLPHDKKARVTLGQVYYAAGMSLNAKRELEAAIALDPGDEFVKNLLRELGK